MKNPKYKIIFSLALFFALGFLLSIDSSRPSQVSSEINSEISESILMSLGGEPVSLSFAPGDSLYKVLEIGVKQNKITFKTKEYPGLGLFVTEINGLRHGEGGNLLYYVNGKEAEVGVSGYFPKNGDIVEWKLK